MSLRSPAERMQDILDAITEIQEFEVGIGFTDQQDLPPVAESLVNILQ
jgi:hypothetical protein